MKLQERLNFFWQIDCDPSLPLPPSPLPPSLRSFRSLRDGTTVRYTSAEKHKRRAWRAVPAEKTYDTSGRSFTRSASRGYDAESWRPWRTSEWVRACSTSNSTKIMPPAGSPQSTDRGETSTPDVMPQTTVDADSSISGACPSSRKELLFTVAVTNRLQEDVINWHPPPTDRGERERDTMPFTTASTRDSSISCVSFTTEWRVRRHVLPSRKESCTCPGTHFGTPGRRPRQEMFVSVSSVQVAIAAIDEWVLQTTHPKEFHPSSDQHAAPAVSCADLRLSELPESWSLTPRRTVSPSPGSLSPSPSLPLSLSSSSSSFSQFCFSFHFLCFYLSFSFSLSLAWLSLSLSLSGRRQSRVS